MSLTKRGFEKLKGDWRTYGSLLMFFITVIFTSGFDVGCPPPSEIPPPEGTYDPRFYEGGVGVQGKVNCMVTDPRSGMVFVGGQFRAAAAGSAYNIAIYDPAENSLQPLANGGVDSGGIVKAMVISGNYLYVGGYFSETYDGSVNGLNHIARYKILPDPNNPGEQRWFPLAEEGTDTPVLALAIAGDKLFVGGGAGAEKQHGHEMHGLAIYENINDINGGNWRNVAGGGLTGFVNALAVNGNDVYVGGGLTKPFVGATPVMNRIGRYHIGTSPNPDSWYALRNQSSDTGLDSVVNALAVSGDYLYVGGGFTHAVGSVPAIPLNYIGRYNMEAADFQTAWSPLSNDGLSGSVYALKVFNNKMFVGGTFTQTADASPLSLSKIAVYELTATTWNAMDGDGLVDDVGENLVDALEVSDNFLYAGGCFNRTNDSSRTDLHGLAGYTLSAVVRPGKNQKTSATVPNANIGPLGFHNGKALNNTIAGLAADASGNIYAGGAFTRTADGTIAGLNRIARYDPATAVWSALANDGLNGPVYAVAVDGDNLYVGGDFTRTGDNTVILNRIARYNLTTNTWSPLNGNGLNGVVYALAISGSSLFAGGDFSRTANNSVLNLNRIARFNTSTSVWSPLTDNGLSGLVNSLVISGNQLYAGGFFFQTFGGATTNLNYVGRYDIATNTWSPLTGNGLNDNARLSVFGSSLYLRGNFTQTFNGSTALNKRAHYDTSTNTWSPIGGAQADLDRSILVNVMLRVGNELYIAGSFNDMGGAPAQYLTRIYLQQWKVPATSSDWFDNANWATGTAPAANSNAVIPIGAGNINIAAADVVMHDLNINGGTLNIATGRTLTINGILSLNGGTITGGGTVAVTNCLPDGIMGGERFVYIQTTLIRCVNGSDPFVFPVGTANGYAPVIVRDIAESGNLSVKANQGAYSGPSSGLPVNRLARWWQIENPGGGVTSSNVIFGYNDADILGVESGYRAYRISGGNANLVPSTVNIYSNRVTATGVTGFSDWTLAQGVSTAAPVSVTGRVLTADGRGITNAVVTITDQLGNQRTVMTGRFGTFRFDGLTAGETCVLTVRSRRFTFDTPTRVITLVDNVEDVYFIASPPQVRSTALRINYDKFRSVR